MTEIIITEALEGALEEVEHVAEDVVEVVAEAKEEVEVVGGATTAEAPPNKEDKNRHHERKDLLGRSQNPHT